MGVDRDPNASSEDMEDDILPTVDSPGGGGIPARLEANTAVDGRYRIDRVLGAGGMGAIYLATDLQLERPVALKTIRSDMAAHPRMAERFRREAVAIARLRHPHIVTVHDYGVAAGIGAYIVMELLDGVSLRTELNGAAPIEPLDAIALVRQVCQAVGAAHQAGVIHLDLKPENIVIERAGQTMNVKVVDFGLAKLGAAVRSDADAVSLVDATFGTPAYMSPEQCLAEKADARSDIYSLGCVLFELLTGRPPFIGRPAMSLLYKHVNDEPLRPSQIDPAIGRRLDDIVGRAIAKDPDLRYQSMAEFADALDSPHAAPASSTFMIDGSTQEARYLTTERGAWIESEPPGNLPQPISRFFGRASQIDAVQSHLTEARLVTLVGPGGIGKTRLSLEVAGRSRDAFGGGVWLVELAALADPALVPHAVSAALGIHEEPGASVTGALVAWLRDRRALLVLDNCEHLVGACATLAMSLLRACPSLRILASSREPLGVAGEAVFAVPALTVPDPDTPVSARALAGFEATRMFIERASLGRPGFSATQQNATLIAEVCQRLDGIPLAIELAAACVTTLSISQIAANLDDRFRLLTRGSRTAPPRQQTLRAAIDWSHDLLTDDERTLLRRLSVFAGGFTYEAVEFVSALDVLEPLNRLVDTSLVQAEERSDGSFRYRTFETVREYAEEKLDEAGESVETQDRHRIWCLGLVETAEPHLTGARQAEWIGRLHDEHDNFRAALRACVEARDVETGLRLCYTLGRFWSVRSHLKEGRRWLEQVLAIEGGLLHSCRPRVLLWDSQLSRLEGDISKSRARLDESQALATALGDVRGIAAALLERATIENRCRNLDRSVEVALEAKALCESIGDMRGVGLALTAIGNCHCERGDFDLGTEFLESALAVLREVGELRGLATILSNIGRLVAMRGDVAHSRALLAEGIEISKELGDRTVLAFCTNSLGLVASQSGDYDEAMRCFVIALQAYRDFGILSYVAEVLESMATVAVHKGDACRAAVLIGAASGIHERAHVPISAGDQLEVESGLAIARQSIGDEAVEAAIVEGRTLTLDEAIAFAIAGVAIRTDPRDSGP